MTSRRLKPGLYLAHKPIGVTSFSLVQSFMEEAAADARTGKPLPVCHGGTLDPFAEGLLLLLAGPATRLMDLLHTLPKRYLVEIAWGRETHSGDRLGTTVSEGDASHLTPARIEQAMVPFLGWQEQVPPSTSAKKIQGEPAYRRVHRGESVKLPPSRVYLHTAQFTGHDLPRTSSLELVCRGGYYVRSLARDLGQRLGCGAHVAGLRRMAIGPWEDPGVAGARSAILGPSVLPWTPLREVTREERRQLKARGAIPRGRVQAAEWPLPAGFPEPATPLRAVDHGVLFALLEERDGLLRSTSWLAPGLGS